MRANIRKATAVNAFVSALNDLDMLYDFSVTDRLGRVTLRLETDKQSVEYAASASDVTTILKQIKVAVMRQSDDCDELLDELASFKV